MYFVKSNNNIYVYLYVHVSIFQGCENIKQLRAIRIDFASTDYREGNILIYLIKACKKTNFIRLALDMYIQSFVFQF